MIVIDGQVFVGPFISEFGELPYLEYKFYPDEVLKIWDKAGVDKGIIMPQEEWWSTNGQKVTHIAVNRKLSEHLRKHPDRFIGFARLNPWWSTKENAEECLTKLGFMGLKFHPQMNLFSPASPIMDPFMDVASKHSPHVVKIHTGIMVGSYGTDIVAATELADRYPELTFVLDHMGSLNWAEAILICKRFDNTLLNFTQGPLYPCGRGVILKRSIQALGPERVLWGSDMPFADIWAELKNVDAANLTSKERELVMGENWARILKLK